MKRYFYVFLISFWVIIAIESPFAIGHETKLIPNDSEDRDRFGISVSISDNHLIVGASGDDDKGWGAGAAYVFVKRGSDWIAMTKLTASDGKYWDSFGTSVDICGDFAIIGAPRGKSDTKSDTGAAYIFKKEGSTWTEVAKLNADNGEIDDYFGHSVSINGNYAIVGAFGDDDKGSWAGAAYVFENEAGSWKQVNKLTALIGRAQDNFGMSVSISGDYAVVGASYSDWNGDTSGSVYIFTRSEDLISDGPYWGQTDRKDGLTGALFGCSVDIFEDTIISGASDAAYILERDRSDWIQTAKLIASDAAELEYFGCAVSISRNYAVVGASGAAYVFQKKGRPGKSLPS